MEIKYLIIYQLFSGKKFWNRVINTKRAGSVQPNLDKEVVSKELIKFINTSDKVNKEQLNDAIEDYGKLDDSFAGDPRMTIYDDREELNFSFNLGFEDEDDFGLDVLITLDKNGDVKNVEIDATPTAA